VTAFHHVLCSIALVLEAGVQVADDGVEADDLFAVQVDDQAEHAVGGTGGSGRS